MLKAAGAKRLLDFRLAGLDRPRLLQRRHPGLLHRLVDDLRLYDHALTPAEVQPLYDQPILQTRL